MNYRDKINNVIHNANMQIATEKQLEIINNYKNKKGNNISYGVANDILFIEFNNKTFCNELPFVYDGEMLNKQKDRFKARDNRAYTQIEDVYSGIHIFIDERISDAVKEESRNRGIYKNIEHQKGDNTDNVHRINTGSICEMAIEKFSNTKTTDFSKPSFHSTDFKVADNAELNIGIKSCEQYNAGYIIETDAERNELLCVKTQRKTRKGNHIVCRGFVDRKKLIDKNIITKNSLVENGIFAKSFFFNTKTGFIPQQTDIDTFYSLNEINFNKSNNKQYIANNLIIGKETNFSDLSESFISSFEKIIRNNDTTIVYVNVNLLGFKSFSQFSKQYETTNSLLINDFENFAMKYKLGVVFYDTEIMKKRIFANKLDTHYPNFKADNYIYGRIEKDGTITPSSRRKEKNS